MALTKVIGAGLGSVSSADLDGAVTINESSADKDFRVESNGQANMLFVDGGNDKIGIGLNSPNTSLHIRSSTASNIAGYRDGTTGLIVEGDAASYIQLVASKTNPMAILFDGGDSHNDTARGGLIYDIDTGLSIKSGGSTRWTVNETGNLVPSATSLGIYLGVASATASNLLDDYEEGTFTPAYSQASANATQLGKYTKIGNMVIVNIRYQGTHTASSTALGKITGLPFTIHDNCSHLTINTREYSSTGKHLHANLNPSTTESYSFTDASNGGTFGAGAGIGLGFTFAYAIQGS